MNAVVIEHVKVEDLPEDWRARLAAASQGVGAARVTVRLEAEGGAPSTSAADQLREQESEPLFGMWRDRVDMADVAGYVRRLRRPRFEDDGAAANNREG